MVRPKIRADLVQATIATEKLNSYLLVKNSFLFISIKFCPSAFHKKLHGLSMLDSNKIILVITNELVITF